MPDSPLEPLTLPRDLDGWRAFADERPRDLLDRVTAIDLRLISETELTLRERLSLWNEADIALAEAAAPSHLLSESHPDEGVRDAAEKQAQLVDAVQSRRLLDTALWAVFSDADDAALDADEQRLLAQVRRDFRRGGVDLSDAERERVRELAERDTTLSLTFSRNIREGRREIRVPASSLGGLPADFLDAHPADAEGMVTLTTEYTDLMPVREYASDRAVRHALVGAYNDLAWPENEAVLAELLAVRAERAALLGYGDWADYETETRMIGSSAAIASFLDQVAAAVGPAASRSTTASSRACSATTPTPRPSRSPTSGTSWAPSSARSTTWTRSSCAPISGSTVCSTVCSPPRAVCSTSSTSRSPRPRGTTTCAPTTWCAGASASGASTSTSTRATASTTTRPASGSRPASPDALFPSLCCCATSRAACSSTTRS